MEKLIINFTPTGMIPIKSQTPHVPITPEEIIEDVRKACRLGITMVHLHARDEADQKPVYQKSVYEKIIAGIKKFAPDLVICVTTSGRTFNQFEQRSDVLKITAPNKPDMASLTLSSLNFNSQASINDPDMIKNLAKTMLENNIKPELEVFDLGMINYAKYLIHKGLLKPPYYFNIILGNIACAQADLSHMGLMIRELPENSLVSFGGVGNAQYQVNAISAAAGYGVRIGLEDNIWMDDNRTELATNEGFILRIHRLANALGRSIMTPVELRNRLKLK